MTGFVPAFLNGGPNHQVTRAEGGAYSLRPRGDAEAALRDFQHIVSDVERSAGLGDIAILARHENSDVGVGLVDLLVVRVL